MTAEFSNVYDDRDRAKAYASLEFPGTYYLAYRDLPAMIGDTCGAARQSTSGVGPAVRHGSCARLASTPSAWTTITKPTGGRG